MPAPEFAGSAGGEEYVGPRTPVEELVAGIWADVLQVEQVGIYDNFFDLGGHSLLATQVMSRVRAVFQIELPLRTLFEEPRIEALAASVEQQRGAGLAAEAPPIRRVNREERLRLSFAQQRLWFIEQLNPGSAVYNVPLALRLSGRLEVAALEASLTGLVKRHESLRTRFVAVDGEPVQVIEAAQPVRLELQDLSEFEEAEREAEAQRLIKAEAGRPFDLAQGVARGALLKLSDEEHLVLLTLHHIVSDGWSMGVLTRELSELYAGQVEGREVELPALPVQYADYAAWQREWLSGAVLEEQLHYWKQQLGGELPVLSLATDYARPAVQTFAGAAEWLELSAASSQQLRELSRREGVTLFMTLLAGWQVLLGRYAGQEEVVVGTPIAGRNRLETEGLIGFFVNTLALRTDLSGDPGFVELLGRVRETTLQAYEHQDVPFEKLVEELQSERDLSRTPLFQVMFALQNAADEKIALPELEISLEGSEQPLAKFDLTLELSERDGQLVGAVEYNTDLFAAATIKRLGNIGSSCDSRLSPIHNNVSQNSS